MRCEEYTTGLRQARVRSDGDNRVTARTRLTVIVAVPGIQLVRVVFGAMVGLLFFLELQGKRAECD